MRESYRTVERRFYMGVTRTRGSDEENGLTREGLLVLSEKFNKIKRIKTTLYVDHI